MVQTQLAFDTGINNIFKLQSESYKYMVTQQKKI